MSVLVVDVGTSGLRSAVVGGDGEMGRLHYRPLPPTSRDQLFVEFDPAAVAAAAVDLARAALEEHGRPVAAVGIANQRSSTVVWERRTGQPVGPGIGWQDLRTAGICLALRPQGIRLAPNESATKLAFLLDLADPGRRRDLCFGTVDTWIAWTLSGGRAHVTDASNAGLTGMLHLDASGWNADVLAALRIPASVLPEIVDSSGRAGTAAVLAGSPPIAGLAGDQQASLLGQGCVRPGLAKLTFGTGGMLDMCTGPERPAFDRLGPAGCFPIVAWRIGGELTWGVEAAMLSAGQSVAWLCDDLGILDRPGDSEIVAAGCKDTNGVMFVPALQGLGAPIWDLGARGTLLGLARGVGRREIVRAVLEGVAHRAVDLVEAAEADGGHAIASLRVDGGMSANHVFVQALADAARRPVEICRVREATTLGAAFLAGIATGVWPGIGECAATWSPSEVVEPVRHPSRDKWRDACDRARRWIPELSELEFF